MPGGGELKAFDVSTSGDRFIEEKNAPQASGRHRGGREAYRRTGSIADTLTSRRQPESETERYLRSRY